MEDAIKNVAKVVLVLDPDEFEKSVESLAEIASGRVFKGQAPELMIISMKWDDDPREIVDIPEAWELIAKTVLGAAKKVGIDQILAMLDMETLKLVAACVQKLTKRH